MSGQNDPLYVVTAGDPLYSPSWMMDVELSVHELGDRAATALMDLRVSWSMCRTCGAARRIGYCSPLRMWGEHTCDNCRPAPLDREYRE